jgi:hypothetical protein
MKKYSKVKLITDKYIGEGVGKESIGYIIEVYDDGNYEIEFSNKVTGITTAQLVVEEKDIELVEE